METGQPLGSWHSAAYVADWIGDDVLADLLALPRQISAALVADSGHPVQHVADLGAGGGSYLAVLLDAFPHAESTWVDSSEPMLEIARERLRGPSERVRYLLGNVERLDELDLEPADVIVTSRVLHHFSPESLQRLYAAVLERLRPGGFFFNLDHFGAPPEWDASYRRIRKQFTGARKERLEPHRHEYPLSRVPEHLDWLRAAGFDEPDVAWRVFYSALIAARKPTPG